MARPRGDGIKRTRKQLADGTWHEYQYWRQRPEEPLPGRPITLRHLIAEYKASPEFRNLRPSTQKMYSGIFRQIIARMGDQPFAKITRADIIRERNLLQDHPAKLNHTLAMYSRVFGHAFNMNYIPSNVALRAGRIEPPKRTQIWTVEEENEAVAAFRPALKLAFMLLLYTLQRPADMLAMTKGRVTERMTERGPRLFIRVKQEKTAELLDLPVHSRLEPFLRERLADPIGGLFLVPNTIGTQWRHANFARVWDRELKRTGITGKQRRDLRRTGVVRLAELGATTPQIASISGHRIDYCQGIIDTYLPRRTEVAIAGIEAWERGGNPVDKVLRLKR